MNIDKELYKNIGLQLKKARENKNISYDALSELIGGLKTKSSLKRYEDGESRIELDVLKVICEKLEINYSDVINNAKSSLKYDQTELIPVEIKFKFDDYFPIHYYSGLSASSFEELIETDPDSVVYVPIAFQNKRKRLHAFKVNGTSMNNIIEDGSIVVVEDNGNSIKYKDGTVVVVFYEGQAAVKRLYEQEDKIILMPDSKDKSHLPITIPKENNGVYIIGKVIWHMNPDDINRRY